MLALQASIGALNDAVDAAADSGRKPGKPIPRGLASPRQALVIAAIGLALGLGLSAPSGAPTLLVAVAGVGCGYLYDLVLKPTALSWLPLVVALPLVPVHAWLGATGTLPPGLTALVPAAVLGGAILAIANGLVDVERDRAADRRTLVVRLGHGPGWVLHALLAVGLVATVAIAAPRSGGIIAGGLRAGELAMTLGLGCLIVGAGLLRHRRPGVRERGWELEALGVAGIGVGWLAGAAGSGS